MNRKRLTSYVQLINTAGVGPIYFKRLMERYGDVEKALVAASAKKEIYPRAKAEEEIMTAEIKKVKIITAEDEEYPYNLKQIEDFPPLLYVMGNIELLKNDNMLAIVGSRNASLSAQRMAEKLSGEVSKNGVVIVSGMARGIDAAAHRGALKVGGATIAVLGTGVDVIYPKENEDLYKEIAEKGVIVSEYPFHTRPQATNFPRRNRIVSGLSKGALVIEAGIQSGSLITAHLALEQGRDVYAVPGAPYDSRAAGCNKLLKEGAVLVESGEDIIENFTFTQRKFEPRKVKKMETADLFEDLLDKEKNTLDSAGQENDDYFKLLSLISADGEDVDGLIRALKLPAEMVLAMIVELEIEGKIIRLPGNRVAKA